MKATITIAFVLLCSNLLAQNKESDKLLKELAANACQCVDSINVSNRSRDDIAKDVSRCIDNQSSAYQLGAKLMDIDLNKASKGKGKKKNTININFNVDKESQEYKDYYYEMERYVMDNCPEAKRKIASNNKESDKSISKNPEAMELYTKGQDAVERQDFRKAVEYYEAALKIDPQFAFAWDNLGICYRRLEQYDKALFAYQKSLEIDSMGIMPLQNIPVVYQYQKEYQKAVEAYDRLARLDKNNPEVYYGLGQVYASNLMDYEKGLDNMCKAYNLYIEMKSPYRTDAEKMINFIYAEMKKQGKEKRFADILKENGISMQ